MKVDMYEKRSKQWIVLLPTVLREAAGEGLRELEQIEVKRILRGLVRLAMISCHC